MADEKQSSLLRYNETRTNQKLECLAHWNFDMYTASEWRSGMNINKTNWRTLSLITMANVHTMASVCSIPREKKQWLPTRFLTSSMCEGLLQEQSYKQCQEIQQLCSDIQIWALFKDFNIYRSKWSLRKNISKKLLSARQITIIWLYPCDLVTHL